jgi:two-component system chemotaxis response regulator CheY
VVRTSEVKWRAGIAIVEDEKDLIRIYIRLFEKRGIPVSFVAYDGNEALLKFIASTPKPHIIMMDYRLPTMNGIEVTKKILEIDSDAKIIFLSADVSVKDQAMRAGAFIFLTKPARIKEVTDAIDTVLKSYPQLPF